jgi:hypothetical protein
MRRLLLSALFCLFVSMTIKADPFTILPNGELVYNTSFTTQGTFTCSACTGSGTNSVTFGSGGNTVTLTFIGANTTVQVGSSKVPASLGQVQVVASGSGFVFPTGGNPNVPLVTLNLGINETSPTAGGGSKTLFAFGGGTSLVFQPLIGDFISLQTGPNPPGFSYTAIVVTLPIPTFTIPNTSTTVNVTGDLSAVPEPTSVLLLTSGAGLMLSLLKRRSLKRRL